MFLKLNRCYILGDKDEGCSEFAMMQLVEGFARCVLNPDSHILGRPEIEDAARLLIQSIDNINRNEYSNLWNTPLDYPPLKQFPPEVVHFL